jgi:hypothetical protein
VKLQFVTTAAAARCPKSGARLLVNASPDGGWTWQVFIPREHGENVRVGSGTEKTDSDARGEARKALARYLGKKAEPLPRVRSAEERGVLVRAGGGAGAVKEKR